MSNNKYYARVGLMDCSRLEMMNNERIDIKLLTQDYGVDYQREIDNVVITTPNGSEILNRSSFSTIVMEIVKEYRMFHLIMQQGTCLIHQRLIIPTGERFSLQECVDDPNANGLSYIVYNKERNLHLCASNGKHYSIECSSSDAITIKEDDGNIIICVGTEMFIFNGKMINQVTCVEE